MEFFVLTHCSQKTKSMFLRDKRSLLQTYITFYGFFKQAQLCFPSYSSFCVYTQQFQLMCIYICQLAGCVCTVSVCAGGEYCGPVVYVKLRDMEGMDVINCNLFWGRYETVGRPALQTEKPSERWKGKTDQINGKIWTDIKTRQNALFLFCKTQNMS